MHVAQEKGKGLWACGQETSTACHLADQSYSLSNLKTYFLILNGTAILRNPMRYFPVLESTVYVLIR